MHKLQPCMINYTFPKSKILAQGSQARKQMKEKKNNIWNNPPPPTPTVKPDQKQKRNYPIDHRDSQEWDDPYLVYYQQLIKETTLMRMDLRLHRELWSQRRQQSSVQKHKFKGHPYFILPSQQSYAIQSTEKIVARRITFSERS